MKAEDVIYLGDGVYASFDGYQIWLDTRGQYPVNRIALDAQTLEAFRRYCLDLQSAISSQRPD